MSDSDNDVKFDVQINGVDMDSLSDEQKEALKKIGKDAQELFDEVVELFSEKKVSMASGTLAAMRVVARGCSNMKMDPECYIKTMCELYRSETGIPIIPLEISKLVQPGGKPLFGLKEDREEESGSSVSDLVKNLKDLN